MANRLPVVRKDGQNVQIPTGDALLLRGALNEANSVTVEAAGTTNIGNGVSANTINVIGTASITSFGPGTDGSKRTLIFASTPDINSNANIILPTAARISARAGDVAEFVSQGASVWKLINYVRSDGTALVGTWSGGTLVRAINEAPKGTKASATSLGMLSADVANTFDVTGTTAIGTLGNGCTNGTTRRLVFQGVMVLTKGQLLLPTGANITTAVGDVAEFVCESGYNWRCTTYTRADGTALVSSGGGSGPASTDALPEGTTNLYFTGARTLASPLTGFASSTGTVTTADSILIALGKLQGTKVDAVAGKGLSTNDYTTAEKTKLSGIAAGATANSTDAVLLARANHTGTQAISTVVNLQTSLDAKVDKVAGQGLSDTNFTQAEKTKLAGLDPNHFRGTFTTLAALTSGVTSPVAGDYADVDPGTGTDALRYIYDVNDTKWVGGGASTSLTAAQVKTLYESNADTNAYTNAEKTKLSGIATGATANANTDSLTEGSSNLYFTGARVLAALLTGLSLTTGGAIVSSDSVLVAFGKIQKQITDLTASVATKEGTITGGTTAQYWNGAKAFVDFATSVRAAVLTGLDLTVSTAVVAGDTLLTAIGKLQGQITALTTSVAAKLSLTGGALTGKLSGTVVSMADYLDKTVTNAAATGTVTLDLSVASVFDLTLTGNTTLAFSNVPALSGETYAFLVIVRQGATAYTLALPGTVTPVTTGAAAVPTPGASKRGDFIFSTGNGTAFDVRAGAAT